MKAEKIISDAIGKFDSTAQAILTYCEESGLQLRVEGGELRIKGEKEVFASWQPILARHKPEIIAHLSGQPYTSKDDAAELATLGADYAELTACIIELCQFAGYVDDMKNRMLAARQNLFPFKYGIEAAYFRLQVIRAKAGVYWHAERRPA
jgi:hypothetical protein